MCVFVCGGEWVGGVYLPVFAYLRHCQSLQSPPSLPLSLQTQDRGHIRLNLVPRTTPPRRVGCCVSMEVSSL